MANVLTSCDHPQNEKLPHKIFNKHDDLVNDKAFPALPLKATTTIVYIRENLERRQNLFYNKKARDFFSSPPCTTPYEPLAGRRVTTYYSLAMTFVIRGFELDPRGRSSRIGTKEVLVLVGAPLLASRSLIVEDTEELFIEVKKTTFLHFDR